MQNLGRILKIAIFSIWLVYAHPSLADENVLSPEQAFNVDAVMVFAETMQIHIAIADGYYLYREKLQFTLQSVHGQPTGLNLSEVSLPIAHEKKFDETFQKSVEIYRHGIDIPVLLPPQHQDIALVVSYQGCADQGVCYPPMQARFSPSQLSLATNLSLNSSLPKVQSSNTTAMASLWAARNDAIALGELLMKMPLSYLILGLVLLGLALCFTPCSLPMIPIVSAIVVGHGADREGRRRAFFLSVAYVLGMALMYSLAGIFAALAGASLAAYLQNSWALIFFALILLAMAASLFGWYEVRMPAWLSHPLHKIARRLHPEERGIPSAFLMGAFSGLIVGPCMTPPLAAILLVIAHTGSPFLGGVLLFSLAIGIGLPLILLGIGAGRYVPRTGPWMIHIKQLFGVLLVLLAIWMVWPILSKNYAHFFRADADHMSSSSLPFVRVASLAELQTQLSMSTRPVMLDFYADWCISCKEMEKLTLKHTAIRQRLADVTWLQVDVTANTLADKALLKHFNLFGPPAILFFNAQGQEIKTVRVIGYQNVEQFQRSIANALAN